MRTSDNISRRHNRGWNRRKSMALVFRRFVPPFPLSLSSQNGVEVVINDRRDKGEANTRSRDQKGPFTDLLSSRRFRVGDTFTAESLYADKNCHYTVRLPVGHARARGRCLRADQWRGLYLSGASALGVILWWGRWKSVRSACVGSTRLSYWVINVT